jgi:lipopolysaccharide biosynthesis glycosyltransferase
MSSIPWFICLNDLYQEQAKVAVATAEICKNFKRYCLYNGNDEAFVRFLESYEVTVIRGECAIHDEIHEYVSDPNEVRTACSTYLRLDVPVVLKKLEVKASHYLYTDVDVLFQSDPYELLNSYLPETFAAAGENAKNCDVSKHFNAGVLWCNSEYMLETYDALITSITDKQFKFAGRDQGALNSFYKTSVKKLSDLLNWKTYWGINDDASIIHYHGMQSDRAEKLIELGASLFAERIPGLKPLVCHSKHAEESIIHYYRKFQSLLKTL